MIRKAILVIEDDAPNIKLNRLEACQPPLHQS